MDSQESTPMNLDNPNDQIRRIWQDNLESSRLHCFTSVLKLIEVLRNFPEENILILEYWERMNEIVYNEILPVPSHLYNIKDRQRTKDKGLRNRQVESVFKELIWTQEFQGIILERTHRSNISCPEIALTSELEYFKEEQMKVQNPNKLDYLDIWRRHMDICTEYVNLQRDTLNEVDHLRARVLIDISSITWSKIIFLYEEMFLAERRARSHLNISCTDWASERMSLAQFIVHTLLQRGICNCFQETLIQKKENEEVFKKTHPSEINLSETLNLSRTHLRGTMHLNGTTCDATPLKRTPI